MDKDQFEDLLEVLEKMSTLQIHTLTKVTRLQAQVLTQQRLIESLLRAQGGNWDTLSAQIDQTAKRYDEALLDGLKDWLAKNEMATPSADDPWWDKPRE